MAETNKTNVQFLRGPQANLDALNNYQAGAFYLTEDTDRLYFAQSNSELVYLNKYVIQVNNIDSLPNLNDVNVGDFYYAVAENILCVKQHSGSTTWTQINKNTNTHTEVISATFENITEKDNTNTLEYKFTIGQKLYDEGGEEITGITINDVIANLSIPVSEMIASGVQVAQNGTIEDNKFVLYNSGNGANEENKVILNPAGGISFSKDEANNLSIASETYNLGSTAVIEEQLNPKIKLFTGDGDEVDSIELIAGQDINYIGSEDNKIKINHNTYDYSTADLEDAIAEFGKSFNIISGLDVSNGHVTRFKTATVTLPEDPDTDTIVSSISADNNGIITIGLTDKGGDDLPPVKTQAELYYKIGEQSVYNQGDLKEYLVTKTELKALNAMVYKGTINSQDDMKNINDGKASKIGDTWLVNTVSVEYSTGNYAYQGDLLIVNGTENDNEIVENIVWDYVPDSNTDTQYTLSHEGTIIKLIDDEDAAAGSVNLSNGGAEKEPIIVENGGKDGIIIRHSTNTLLAPTEGGSATLNHAGEFTVIDNVEFDGYGHVIACSSKVLTLPEETTYKFAFNKDNKSFTLATDDDSNINTVSISNGTAITVTPEIIEASENAIGSMTFNISHADITCTTPEATDGSLAEDRSFEYISGVTVNSQGHVTNVSTTKLVLPEDKDTQFVLSGKVENNIVSIDLHDDGGTNAGNVSFEITSDSLVVETAEDTISMNLVWGSF